MPFLAVSKVATSDLAQTHMSLSLAQAAILSHVSDAQLNYSSQRNVTLVWNWKMVCKLHVNVIVNHCIFYCS